MIEKKPQDRRDRKKRTGPITPNLFFFGVALLMSSPSESAESMRYEIQSGATLTFQNESARSLSGELELSCPAPPEFGLECRYQTGEVKLDVTSLKIAADGFLLSGSGKFSEVASFFGLGFSVGRQLIVHDVGSLSLPPATKEARLLYGFDAEWLESSPTTEHYRVWQLSTPDAGEHSWSGLGPMPDSMLLDMQLTEIFWELGPGTIANSEGRSAALHVPLVAVPEPSFHALGWVAASILGALRVRLKGNRSPVASRSSSGSPGQSGD